MRCAFNLGLWYLYSLHYSFIIADNEDLPMKDILEVYAGRWRAENKLAVKIRKRAHAPVLKEVEKLQKPFKVPRLSCKTAEIVRTA